MVFVTKSSSGGLSIPASLRARFLSASPGVLRLATVNYGLPFCVCRPLYNLPSIKTVMRVRHNHLQRAICAASLLFFAGGCAAQQPADPKPNAPSPDAPTIRFVRNPDAAPEIKLTALDGKPIALGEIRGKVVLLNFWATWCGPCRAEIPDLIELQKKYPDKLQVLGLAVDEDSPDDVKQYAGKVGINYPVAIPPAELRAKFGGIPALPTSFLLDTQGRIVQKHVGLSDPALYETEVRALAGLPVDAKVETFEDTGQVFLANATRATELPGVDLSKLTPDQKKAALRRFNAESCTCGCTLTLAQCRINDSACKTSQAITAKIVAEMATHPRPAQKNFVKNP